MKLVKAKKMRKGNLNVIKEKNVILNVNNIDLKYGKISVVHIIEVRRLTQESLKCVGRQIKFYPTLKY
jgi:hypothetical protein